jgi:hypothetical protein
MYKRIHRNLSLGLSMLQDVDGQYIISGDEKEDIQQREDIRQSGNG